MADGFVEFIDRANVFFAELALNNRKDWFEPRKEFYRSEIRKPAGLLADLAAEDVARLTGTPHAPKVFRIHRDIRFSKDKTPYNAHLHLLWSRREVETAPAWFFGTAPDYLIVGMGVPHMEKDALARYRAQIAAGKGALPAALDRVLAETGAQVSDWGPPPLQRVPKPYAPDHPRADLLRRKGLTISADLPPDWRDRGLVAAIAARFAAFLPLWRALDDALRPPARI